MEEAERQEPTPQVEEKTEPGTSLSFDEAMAQLDQHIRHDPKLRERLRTHDIVAGIAGEIGSRIASQRLDEYRRDTMREAQDQRERELLELAEKDPDAFAEKFTTQKQSERARKQVEDLRLYERQALAMALGRAINDMPEIKGASSEEMAELAKAVAGIPDDQVISKWHKAVVELVARKRAGDLTEKQLASRLKAEREAWDTEQAAKRVHRETAPSVRTGRGVASNEAPDFRTDPKGFDDWYNVNVLKRPARVQ
jgi:hypothetical protein